MHLRTSLASALTLAALVTFVVLVLTPKWQIAALSASLFALAMFFHRQVVISQTRFLNRVAVAALVVLRIDA